MVPYSPEFYIAINFCPSDEFVGYFRTLFQLTNYITKEIPLIVWKLKHTVGLKVVRKLKLVTVV